MSQVHLVIRELGAGKTEILNACESLQDALAQAGQGALMWVKTMDVQPASRSRQGGETPTPAITGSSITATS
jgi:hypothetical protein